MGNELIECQVGKSIYELPQIRINEIQQMLVGYVGLEAPVAVPPSEALAKAQKEVGILTLEVAEYKDQVQDFLDSNRLLTERIEELEETGTITADPKGTPIDLTSDDDQTGSILGEDSEPTTEGESKDG